ncbi:PTPA-CTERM sorting domain-containing protein [Leptolyngbya ohadii]|uniref:PTPA-CTERM sorting domain-containing protein n=1 Tax=Leptolyngbya ohadii TaxID=1962290 RepID=UPI000B5A11CE|nr:PTPA-CTERM sorting domain-containing protein [Leptolyngbya ohadii]
MLVFKKLISTAAATIGGTFIAFAGLGINSAQAVLLVGNTAGNNVVRYDENTGNFLGTFIPPNTGGLTSPDDIVFGPDGNLYISSGNSSTGKILRFNRRTGAFIDVFATGGGLIRPYGIAFGPDGNLYTSSFLSDQILRFNGQTGAFIDVFAFGNGQPGGLNGPNDLLFTPDGRLLVTTQGSVAVPGDLPGEFRPDFSGGLPSQILSYDILTGASSVFVESATPLPDTFGFVSFLGLAIGPNGDLFTTDFANGIRVYDIQTGALKLTISTNYTSAPGSISSNFIGNLAFVGNTLFTTGFDFTQGNQGAILRYDGLTGEPLPGAGNSGAVFVSTSPNLQRPIGIAYDPAPIPTPALLPGLVGVGIAALRKRRQEQSDVSEA